MANQLIQYMCRSIIDKNITHQDAVNIRLNILSQL